MSNRTALLNWIDLAHNSDLGYDQGQRMSFLDLMNHRIRPHSETDCSALVAGVIALAGYPISLADPVYTGSLREKLTAIGWQAVPIRGLSLSQIVDRFRVPATVFLNETHHVVIQTRTPGIVLSANIDENGNASGGRAGNQTGNEVSFRQMWMYHAGWDYAIIPNEGTGDQGDVALAAAQSPAQDVNKFFTPDQIKLLQKVLGVDVDGIAGEKTIGALVAKAGLGTDTRLDTPSLTVRKVQKYLNAFIGQPWCHYAKLDVDGVLGEKTAAACVEYLVGGHGAFSSLSKVTL